MFRCRKHPGEVPCRRTDQGELVDRSTLIPVKFNDAMPRDAPRAKVDTGHQKTQKQDPMSAGKPDDRVDIEMVVVVVAYDHHVNGRQCFQLYQPANATGAV